MRRRDYDGGIADLTGEHVGHPARRLPAVADGKQCACQSSDHVVAERVGDDDSAYHACLVALPVQPQEFPDRARARPASAKRGEVMFAQAGSSGLVHELNLDGEPVP